MPYKFETDNFKIPRDKDKRVKLSLKDKERIKHLHSSNQYSQRQLATMFNVSRRLIQFYTDDEKLKNHKEKSSLRREDGRYYDTHKHKEYIKTHRNYKKELYKNKELLTNYKLEKEH